MQHDSFESEKLKALQHAMRVKQKQEIKDIRHSNDKTKQKLSFSKVAFIFMIVNCVAIEIYALVVMFFFEDLSSLPTLIAAVIGECVSMIAYFVKADHENTSGGIVYESAMAKLKHELENDDSVG